MDVYTFAQMRSCWLSYWTHGLALLSLFSVGVSLVYHWPALVLATWFFCLRWWLLSPQPELVDISELGEVTLRCPQRGLISGQLSQPQYTGLCSNPVLQVYATAGRQPEYVCWWLDAFTDVERARLRRIAGNLAAVR
ncbi:MAG: hypothetical protein M1363_07270 [Gammaproteobacteria bacterium]|nr:hypothetical protein [Gammaproteobacteria bacterium]